MVGKLFFFVHILLDVASTERKVAGESSPEALAQKLKKKMSNRCRSRREEKVFE